MDRPTDNEGIFSNGDLLEVPYFSLFLFLKVTLSAAMEQAITAPHVEEEEELGAMLAAARGLGESTDEDPDQATRRVVSDKEWQLLQMEVTWDLWNFQPDITRVIFLNQQITILFI